MYNKTIDLFSLYVNCPFIIIIIVIINILLCYYYYYELLILSRTFITTRFLDLLLDVSMFIHLIYRVILSKNP